MIWEVFISVLALLVSGITAFYSYRQGRKSNQLQERIVDIEEQRENERLAKENKAVLRPSFQYGPGNDYYKRIASHIKIKNEGKSKAKNIRMYVDGDPVTQHSYMMQHHDHQLNPIGPDRNTLWALHVQEKEPVSCEIRLLWDDETGRDHEFKEKLPLKK